MTTYISYAQNFEDVMLWRALKHVQNGVYVDVGAQHPVVDSVSKAFYERGWRGIHIEPVPKYADLLRKDRPDETVLQVALADTEGTLELNVIPDTGLSTAVDAYAERHQVERGLEHQRVQVPVLTLKSALKSLVGEDVHWLKIDVEGLEEKVLKGWDSKTLRPWVMVVEATIPNSPETDYASWEPILTAADYQFVYFDGLNRFYVSQEHAELVGAFSCPPNVFDGIELSGLASWGLCRRVMALQAGLTAQAEARYQALQIDWETARDIAEAARQQTVRLEGDLVAERQRLAQFDGELQEAKARESQVREHTEWLTAHAKRLEGEEGQSKQQIEKQAAELTLSREQIASLKSELDSERQRAIHCDDKLQEVITREVRDREHTQWLTAHAERLQSELDAASAKVSELDQHAHHLSSVADGISQTLQSVYASMSWRITWPLRRALLMGKSLASLPKRAVFWARRLPDRPTPVRPDLDMTVPGSQAELPTTALSPRAAWIYANLQKTIEGRKH